MYISDLIKILSEENPDAEIALIEYASEELSGITGKICDNVIHVNYADEECTQYKQIKL